MLIHCGNEPQLSQFSLLCNTGDGELFSNVSHASRLGLLEIDEMKPNGLPAIVCGGGPSLGDTLVNIRALQAAGGVIFALNNTAKFLVEHGIKPDYQVILDPRDHNVEFIEKAWANEILLCSQCHPSLFAHCKAIGYPVRLWHPALPDVQKQIPQKEPLLVSVTTTVGLSAMSLVHVLGHRELHLFGYDSCHRKESSHAYGQPRNAGDEIVRCVVDSEVFYASMTMASQASQFRQIHDMLLGFGQSTVKVYGEGLIQSFMAKWAREAAEKPLTAVYDLGLSPPSFDFLSFLIEAERYRRANGYTCIDVMFQPGPMHGFRDDELPPRIPEREWMLWGICVGMAKLLPSVRNIDVKKTRWNGGTVDIFPRGYLENQPLSHYGTGFLKGGEPMLRASDHARGVRPRTRYATITIRYAPYWPERNSTLHEWDRVAGWLLSQDIEPIFIPDANAIDAIPDDCWKVDTIAAYSLDARCALYEGAVINLGVLNGPMSLLPYLNAKYLIFNIVVESAVASSTEFLKAHGFEHGDQMGGNGKLIWEPDSADVIIRELKTALLETTS